MGSSQQQPGLPIVTGPTEMEDGPAASAGATLKRLQAASTAATAKTRRNMGTDLPVGGWKVSQGGCQNRVKIVSDT